VTAEENPELFWAVKGGGGNFGIAVNLDLRLAAADKVLGGAIAFETDVAKFLTFYSDFMHAAPDALTVELNFFAMDKPVVLAIVCWSGTLDEGEKNLLPLRKFAAPLFDSIRSVSYAHLTDRPPGGRPPPQELFWLGGSLDRLSAAAIAKLAEIMEDAPPGWSVGMGHYMHGAVCRGERDATPFIRRSGQFTYFIGAGWDAPSETARMMGWVNDSMTQTHGLSSVATYVNYLSDNSESAVAASYGENYPRLVALKRKYDPNNIFHHNRNIRP
jgi:FAD/FMN-containing dehydrogenase